MKVRLALIGMAISLALGGVANADDAADPAAPVKQIIAISQDIFKADAPAKDDYFSDKWLTVLFSSALAKQAKEGFAKAQANDEPFIDYDPVLGGQDGCQPKDVSITDAGIKDGVSDVVARFRASYCFDGSDNAFTETHFKVIVENGKAVIDDIVNTVPDGDPISLRDVMKSYFEQ